MNCANHPEVAASAFCRECGKPMCAECQRPALGSIYCAEHLPAAAAPPPLPFTPGTSPAGETPRPATGYGSSLYASAPYTTSAAPASSSFESSPYSAPVAPSAAPAGAMPNSAVHPVLALILGFFPGVGAIYNGQYAKGLIHAVIFGLLVSLASNSRGGSMAAFLGIMIGIWVIYQAFEAYHTSRKRRYGIVVEEFSSLFEVRHHNSRFPIGAILLIGVGFILLLDTTEIINMEQFQRYWPLGLIGLGLYMLYTRLNPSEHASNVQTDGGRQ